MDKEDLQKDIKQFFKTIEDYLPEDKEKLLYMLVEKYATITSMPVLFNKDDLDMIKSYSSKFLIDTNLPKVLGKNRRPVDGSENRVLAIVEGTITHLEAKGCLKKLPKFDYR